jgi:predicted phosphodiesterase
MTSRLSTRAGFRFGWVFLMWAVLLAASPPVTAQDEPFLVHDTKAVILHGPYLSSLSESGATIVWVTDTPCHVKVVYGADGGPDREADNAVHGLLPIGTVHAVHLTGLDPGRTYRYKTVSTRVVRMKAYWPEKGLPVESPERMFTTFDRTKASVSFAAVTDTHEEGSRVQAALKSVDWASVDFLVHLGDAFDGLDTENQLFDRWLGPASKAADGRTPLFFVRGNHEMRGAFARGLFDYVPNPENRFYYARDHGPLHLLVLDTGEDKPDETNVYSRLNRFGAYREGEYAWLESHFAEDPRAAAAPFRVILMHQPHWGWTGDRNAEWTALANKNGIDLVIGGHFHRPRWIGPGAQGNDYPVLVLGQDQVARVEATAAEIRITVIGPNGETAASYTIPAKRPPDGRTMRPRELD